MPHQKARINPWVIREQDPLKQGLKLMFNLTLFENNLNIREQDPLKQGLKPNSSLRITGEPLIREQDPLKQGLKRTSRVWNSIPC